MATQAAPARTRAIELSPTRPTPLTPTVRPRARFRRRLRSVRLPACRPHQRARPAEPAPGSTTITWSSANATAVSVSGTGLTSSAASGSQAVSGLPAGTHTCTVTAQGTGGPVTQTATFTVGPPPNTAPTISWNTTPGTVASGQSYTVSAHGHDPDGNHHGGEPVWRNGVP
jgi:hypothetical protein